MAWTAPYTPVAGDMMTAAIWAVQVRDNFIEVRAGGLAISGQAANRIPYASSSTQLATSANLTFNGTNLAIGAGGLIYLDGGSDTYLRQSSNDIVEVITGAVVSFGMQPGLVYIPATNKLYLDNGSNTYLWESSADVIGLVTGGTTALSVQAGSVIANGYVKATGQPGFLAYNSADDAGVADGATVDFDTEVYDELGNFAADTFTAPVTGRYLFTVTVVINSGSASAARNLYIVTSNRTYQVAAEPVATNGGSLLSGSVIADMDASDTASVRINVGSGTLTIDGDATAMQTYFSGCLLP